MLEDPHLFIERLSSRAHEFSPGHMYGTVAELAFFPGGGERGLCDHGPWSYTGDVLQSDASWKWLRQS